MHIHISTAAAAAGCDPLALALRLAGQGALPAILLADGSAQTWHATVLAADPLITLSIDCNGVAQLRATPDVPAPVMVEMRAAVGIAPDHFACFQGWLDALPWADAAAAPAGAGVIGGISYEAGRRLELPPRNGDSAPWPLLEFTLYRRYFIFPARGATVLAAVAFGNGQTAAESLLSPMQRDIAAARRAAMPDLRNTAPSFTAATAPAAAEIILKVREALAYIAAGDIYQANIAARWVTSRAAAANSGGAADALNVFVNLCRQSPAPFAAFLPTTAGAVASASPEMFIQKAGSQLRTCPIKGTRPRSANAVDDAAQRDALIGSSKERAELAMIVDLLRNDLSRICVPGSVQVRQWAQLTAHRHVWHAAADIAGELKAADTRPWQSICQAMLPGGSITGAPKIRAMQIIDELEGFDRHWYCGNAGYVQPNGDGQLNILIRTIFMENFNGGVRGVVYAGAGIVADSRPEQEYAEMLLKARAPLAALGIEK